MVGGIHTVLASRVPDVQQRHGEDGYITIGPDVPRGEDVAPEFRPDIWDRELADSLQDHEVGVEMGRWLVPGEPRCLLINQSRLYQRKDEILGRYWESYGLDSLFGAWDYYDPVLFAHGAGMIIEHIRDRFLLPARQAAIVQAHEWMSAGAILHLQTAAPEIGTVFTTHATMLGRSLAGQRADPNFYQSLPSIDPEVAAKELNVSSKHSMESVAAHEADVFTTVSEITALECEYLLGRKPDVILPNGFGARPVAAEQRQRAREELFKLAELTTGDQYDRENTLIFALAGRYEYTNKGVDVYLDAAADLAKELESRDGKRVLVYAMLPAGHAEPKRQLWDRAHGTSAGPPLRCTHDLVDEANDPITKQLNALGFENTPGARVHVVHVPIYLDGTDPLDPPQVLGLASGRRPRRLSVVLRAMGIYAARSGRVWSPRDHDGPRWLRSLGCGPGRSESVQASECSNARACPPQKSPNRSRRRCSSSSIFRNTTVRRSVKPV